MPEGKIEASGGGARKAGKSVSDSTRLSKGWGGVARREKRKTKGVVEGNENGGGGYDFEILVGRNRQDNVSACESLFLLFFISSL